MYNTVDSISSQLAILHMPEVIYMPSRNGPAIPQRPRTYIYQTGAATAPQYTLRVVSYTSVINCFRQISQQIVLIATGRNSGLMLALQLENRLYKEKRD